MLALWTCYDYKRQVTLQKLDKPWRDCLSLKQYGCASAPFHECGSRVTSRRPSPRRVTEVQFDSNRSNALQSIGPHALFARLFHPLPADVPGWFRQWHITIAVVLVRGWPRGICGYHRTRSGRRVWGRLRIVSATQAESIGWTVAHSTPGCVASPRWLFNTCM